MAVIDLGELRDDQVPGPPLPGLLGDCRVGAGLLVRWRADGGFGLWRLP
ncbi:hypothetical protein [Micromonospora sp. RTP1Z1]|nr:hypothetical protein [Micromonospora sp. RTP1Z1]